MASAYTSRSVGAANIANGAATHFYNGPTKPTAAAFEIFPRQFATVSTTALVSARITCMGIGLPAGFPLTSVSFLSGTTAANTPANQWVVLCDASRNKLAISADLTNTAWAANSIQTFTISYTIPATGLYYLGLMVKANTVPTLTGPNTATAFPINVPPILWGTADTGMDTPANCPTTLTALTAGAVSGWGYVA